MANCNKLERAHSKKVGGYPGFRPRITRITRKKTGFHTVRAGFPKPSGESGRGSFVSFVSFVVICRLTVSPTFWECSQPETGNRKPKTGNRKPETGNRFPGFTLLELLISLTIIAVIVVLVSGALKIGVRAWEKGERDIESHQRQRIVLNLMKRQMASVCLRTVKKGKQSFVFKGDNTSLAFLSYISLIPGNRFGMAYVKYVIQEHEGKDRLSFYEKNIVLSDKNADTDEPNEEDFHELIPAAEHIEFEYLKKGSEEPEWQQIWDPENDKRFPLAVRIVFKKDAEATPVHVIARILREADS